jgi:hypothetical protein
MRIPAVASFCALVALATGCAPSAEVSGWEVAQKRTDDERMESFPELPVVLPRTPEAAPSTPSTTGLAGVYSKRLDEGSLFRRGYSVPTP